MREWPIQTIPIKVRKRPIKEGKRAIEATVLVGVSVGCLMGCFRVHLPWWKMRFISRDACSDSIAKHVRACFHGGIAQLSSDMVQMGYCTDVPVLI